jgi:c-di-GMP-binding flagellar brake protein YcgR
VPNTKPQHGRRFPRVSVGQECSIQFEVAGHVYEALPVKDIGLGGCGILVPTVATDPLEKDVTLENLIVNHPNLPGDQPTKARIAFVLGKHNPHPDAHSIIGIEFIDIPADFRQALEGLVSELLSQQS